MTYILSTEHEQLKQELRLIVEHEFAVPEGTEPYEMVLRIVGILGSPDGELRDALGYRVLGRWIYRQRLLTPPQLQALLKRAISDEMLFHKIGESGTDSVFTRTFSSLLIALVLIVDNQDTFLPEEDVRAAMEAMVRYCGMENDLRGYVEGSGWAHGAAHVADALDECVRSRYTTLDECALIWQGLSALLIRAQELYQAEEDERLAVAAAAMVETGKVPVAVLCDWMVQASTVKTAAQPQDVQRINWKHFVRSLYMRLQEKGLLGGDDEALVIAAERKFNQYAAL